MNKTNIVGFQSAETGIIYDFLESDGTIKNKALVLQNDKRAEENLVSILVLGTKKGGSDSVPVKLDGTYYYVHCGLITYCRRERLGKRVGSVSQDTIDRIKKSIMWQLGLTDTSVDYQRLYEELLDRLARGNSND